MNVDITIGSYADLSYKTVFVVYLLALICSLIHYMKSQSVHDAEGDAAVEAPAAPISLDDAAASADLDAQRRNAEKWGGMANALVWLGLILHVLTFVLRGIAVRRFPLGNLYEYILGITLVTVFAAAVVVARHRAWRAFWPWVLTPILALLFLAVVKLYAAPAPLVPVLQSYWLPIHVSTVSIGASVAMFSGIVSLLYLLRMAHPKPKKGEKPAAPKGLWSRIGAALARPLPSAKTLDTIAYRAAILSFPIFGLGIVLGAIWAESSWGRPWGWDPKETFSFVTWILLAAYLHARATAGWKAYWASWINILALAAMIFNLFFVNLVSSGLHSYAGLN